MRNFRQLVFLPRAVTGNAVASGPANGEADGRVMPGLDLEYESTSPANHT
jgi:hypothetical protein